MLPGGDIEAVPDVDRADGDDQGRQRRLVVVAGGFIPEVVGYRIGPVAEPGRRLRQGQGRPLGVVEVGRVAPGGYGEDALVRFL